MKSYDLVYILRPDLEQEALKGIVDRLAQRIQDQGGTVEAVDIWGKKRMSYTLKKHREGVFVHTRFTIDAQKVHEIRRIAALTEDVLRATLTNAVGKAPGPAAPPAPPAPAVETRDATTGA